VEFLVRPGVDRVLVGQSSKIRASRSSASLTARSAGCHEPADYRILAGWKRGTDDRETIVRSTRSLHLVHVIKPSAERGPGWFEIFAFLVGHRRQRDGHPPDLSDVVRAEFFLGRHWGNRIIEAEIRPGRPIGLATSAYGPTLCLCRVTFADGGPPC